MGHSNLNVSLTYLRGLNFTELSEEDMPELKSEKQAIQGIPIY